MRRFLASIAAAAIAAVGFLMFPSSASAQTVSACSISPAPLNCSGMLALQVNQVVPNGAYAHDADPGCMNDATGDIQRVLDAALVAAYPQIAIFSGPLSTAVAGPVNDYLRNQGGDIGRLFSPYSKNAALCASVIGVIPVKATYVGWRLLATDDANGGEFRECIPGNDCAIGWSKFPNEPLLLENSKVKTVSAMFMNWSHDRTRIARMIIFYRLPPGEPYATHM